MIDIALTALFLATGAYALVRWTALVSGRTRDGDRTAELSHLAMSVAMIVMTWGWSGTVGDRIQLAVFGGFGLYFLVRLVGGAGHGRVAAGYHLLMSVAMVWMVAAMPLLMSASGGAASGSGGHAGHGGAATAPMVGMEPAPGWVTTVSVALVVALVVAAAWWTSHVVHRPVPAAAAPSAGTGTVARARPPRLLSDRNDAVCHTLMSAGMAAMLLVML